MKHINTYCKLAETDLCTNLNSTQLKHLEQLATVIDLKKGDSLFQQHCLAKQMFMVVEGAMLVERSNRDGKRQILAFLFPGDFIGFTPNEFLEYSATALAPRTQVQVFSRNKLTRLGDQHPIIKANIALITNKILAYALDHIFAISHKKAHEKLCYLFKRLHNRLNNNNECYVSLLMTRQDIGDYLGLTLESVSRALAKLRTEGIISIHSNIHINILNMDKFNQYANLD